MSSSQPYGLQKQWFLKKWSLNYAEIDSLDPFLMRKLPTHIWQVAELLFECGRLLQKLQEAMLY